MEIKIRAGSFQECVELSKQIPEFDSPYGVEEYQNRCIDDYQILIAELNKEIAGFKVGYNRFDDGSFYGWMSGVLPEFRHKSIATELANFQEDWAIKNGYKSIKLKTRKKHKTMIIFSLNRGFIITETIEKQNEKESRIWMQKDL
ncbi:MAG: GNAT family N-acetyltransferase [Candidatus Marinimicrobia bacterium]|nr:GNAT family N-acetyltransferase [Candidatus Neomarinimicrobiota bacterium]MBT5759542.1 GNAT family N-acetyltransferase [Candidatus Neomarinimicrobiota bacterium]